MISLKTEVKGIGIRLLHSVTCIRLQPDRLLMTKSYRHKILLPQQSWYPISAYLSIRREHNKTMIAACPYFVSESKENKRAGLASMRES